MLQMCLQIIDGIKGICCSRKVCRDSLSFMLNYPKNTVRMQTNCPNLTEKKLSGWRHRIS